MTGSAFGGWDAYAEAVVDVLMGRRFISLGKEGPLGDETWTPTSPAYVITAYNPGGEVSGIENEHAQRRLQTFIASEGLSYLNAVGRSRDHSWREPSYALLDLSETAAIAIGRAFGQDAIFRWDGHTLTVVPCNDVNN